MIELFKHLFDLDFPWLFKEYGTAIYIVLFLVIFIETGLVVMPFLPGDSLLFAAGMFSAQSEGLDIASVLGLLFLAAVLGDTVNYWIGRKLGLSVLKWKIRGRQLVKQKYLDQTHAFFEKNGTKAIIMARFVPIVRTFTPFAAGIGKMSYTKKFLPFDLLGGFLWIFGLTLTGYFLGNVEWIKENISKVILIIILVSVLPMIIAFIKARLAKKRA